MAYIVMAYVRLVYEVAVDGPSGGWRPKAAGWGPALVADKAPVGAKVTDGSEVAGRCGSGHI